MSDHDILLFSDPHLSGNESQVVGQNTDKRLRAALADARNLFPNAQHTIFAGDLSDGSAIAYGALLDMLEGWHTPVTCLMGNDDNRASFQEHFPSYPTLPVGSVQTVLNFGAHAVFCLDSLDLEPDPAHSGLLGHARLEWLLTQLKNSQARHKTVILHHPPIQLGLPYFDHVMLRDGADLVRVLKEFDVDLCITGHVHRRIVKKFDAQNFVTLESTGFGLRLGPGDNEIAGDPDHVPGYGVLRLSKNGAEVLPVTI